jgi:hypothetical protein
MLRGPERIAHAVFMSFRVKAARFIVQVFSAKGLALLSLQETWAQIRTTTPFLRSTNYAFIDDQAAESVVPHRAGSRCSRPPKGSPG